VADLLGFFSILKNLPNIFKNGLAVILSFAILPSRCSDRGESCENELAENEKKFVDSRDGAE
jgi:hypothetical protein